MQDDYHDGHTDSEKHSSDEEDAFSPVRPIDSFEELTEKIEAIFERAEEWDVTKTCLSQLLDSVDLSTSEINKYTYWDTEKAYSRNLVATDGKHYSLLLLCWKPSRESQIHDHPCDGCFVKSIRGCIRETRYHCDPATNEIKQGVTKFYCEDQVSFMNDEIGLHKIGNPNDATGAVSLHLYTPPFRSCKVWQSHGKGQYSRCQDAMVGFCSVFGIRTPHLEGRSEQHLEVLDEIRARGLDRAHATHSTHEDEASKGLGVGVGDLPSALVGNVTVDRTREDEMSDLKLCESISIVSKSISPRRFVG
jgi:cysteine dioxygenase